MSVVLNPKQVRNSNVQIFKTDSKAVILSERPANEESHHSQARSFGFASG